MFFATPYIWANPDPAQDKLAFFFFENILLQCVQRQTKTWLENKELIFSVFKKKKRHKIFLKINQKKKKHSNTTENEKNS